MSSVAPAPLNELPPLREATGLAVGSVYVADAQGQPVLNDGVNAVLETAQGGRVEVLTRTGIGVTVTAAGTYLHASDYGPLVGQTASVLRPYRRRDTLAKLWSAPGFLTALTALLSVVTAVVGTFFVWSTLSSPAGTTVNDRAQSLIEWVVTSAKPGGATERARQAEACIHEIRGQTSEKVTVPGIVCTPVDTPWWRNSDYGALITGVVGLVTALAGAATLRSKFGFQRSPAS